MTDKNQQETNNDNVRYVMVSPDNMQQNVANEEIDLRELWKVIWQGKWIIIVITALFAIASVLYALSLPNIYKSEALLAPASDEQQGGIAGLAGQFGGLASLAGINIGGGKTDKTALAIEILKSREFTSRFIQKHNILPDLMAVKAWDLASGEVIYNDLIYSAETDQWLREVKPPKVAKPSMQEAKPLFDAAVSVTKSKETGMVTISVEHYSPYIAKQWVEWLIEDINSDMKTTDKQEAERSIAYLQSQLEKTTIVEHKTLLYQLIEEQAKTLMFAEVRDEYVFKVIDPALVPELKFKPKRALIVVVASILGGILALFMVFIMTLLRNEKSNSVINK